MSTAHFIKISRGRDRSQLTFENAVPVILEKEALEGMYEEVDDRRRGKRYM